MDSHDGKKLKRGLSDVSALFRQSPQGASRILPLVKSPEVMCMSVFSPGFSGDSMLLNAYIASKIAGPDHFCTILSLKSGSTPGETCKKQPSVSALGGEPFGPYMNRLTLSWDQFEQAADQGMARPYERPSVSQTLFLDMEHDHIPHMEKVIPVLDKWIFHLQPTVESLTEAYKMLKGAASVNQHLECYLLYDGSMKDERGEILFERFSEMISNRLGLNLLWLGHFHMEGNTSKISALMTLEHLFIPSINRHDAVEKWALASLIRTLFESPLKVAV